VLAGCFLPGKESLAVGPIQILFGTESGNSEMVADDIADALDGRGITHEVISLDTFEVEQLTAVDFAIFVTSTYGDGELPMTTAPFHDALVTAQPDLGSLRFAAFGLGDRTYDTYNNAITVLASTLTDLGATQVGDTGRHDASGAESYTDTAVAWVNEILDASDGSN
jgi:MioC protein